MKTAVTTALTFAWKATIIGLVGLCNPLCVWIVLDSMTDDDDE